MPNTSATSSATLSEPSNVSISFRVLKLSLYALIFLISATGNSLVCVVILRKRQMKTVMNYFILNLAIADLTLTCICIPFDIPVQEMNMIWPYGSFMCRVLYPLQTLTLFASVYTLTALSLSRYWAIVHPLKEQLVTVHAKLIIVAVWLLSLVIVSPYVAVSVLQNADTDSPSCGEDWASNSTRRAYTLFLFVFQYVLPLSIIAGAYYCIGVDLRRRARTENRLLQDIQDGEVRKVVRMLKVVTTVFAVCVLPTNIMWLWLDFGQADQHFSPFWELVAFSNIITFSNSASNPICYTILSANFRNEFKDFIGKYVRRLTGGPSSSPSGESAIAMQQWREGSRKPRSVTVSSAV